MIAAVSILFSGCGTIKDIIGSDSEQARLPGKRISILALEHKLEPDLEIADQPVRLPRPSLNPEWLQSSGVPTHVMQHPAADGELVQFWSYDIGVTLFHFTAF